MKRKFDSGACKRWRRKELAEEACTNSKKIYSFFKKSQNTVQIEQANQTQSVSDYDIIENIVVPIAENPISDQQPAGNLNIINQERVETEILLQENAGENKIRDMETEITDPIHQGNPFNFIDIGIISKNNSCQVNSFLKITCFEIPNNIVKDSNHHALPYRFLNKTFANGETCKRDWLCWSVEKQSLYCAPCFLLNKNAANVSFFSSSAGWGIIRHFKRIDGAKPVAQHLNSVRSALNELGVLHLTARAKMELNAIQKYISKFDCILMSSIWMKLLTMIHQTNLIIEARQATLDIEKDNIENLCNDIQRLREQFDKILNESKFVARNIGVSCEFLTNRHFPSQDDAELYFKTNVYFIIIDSI